MSTSQGQVVRQSKRAESNASYLTKLTVREILGGVIPMLLLLVAWFLAFELIPDNTFLRAPQSVGQFVTGQNEWQALLKALSNTLLMVLLGYAVAYLSALIIAIVAVSSRFMEQLVMPVAVVVGSVPIIVIVPVLLMALGRGALTAILVCTIVTYFPCLINVLSGLRSPSRQLIDITASLGGSRVRTLLKVRLPSAVPGLISASKLALPAALSGVILAEFIATSTGIGQYISFARANYHFDAMWAGICFTLIASVLLYSLLGVFEILLEQRYKPIGGATQ